MVAQVDYKYAREITELMTCKSRENMRSIGIEISTSISTAGIPLHFAYDESPGNSGCHFAAISRLVIQTI